MIGINKKEKIMEQNLFNYLFVCSVIAFAGCKKDDVMSGYPTANGDRVVFNASAGYEYEANSRTIYEDFVSGSNNQGISWINGDRVSIYSKTSPNTQQVDYQVITKDGQNSSNAYLSEINVEDVGLQWGSDNQEFCAVFPAKEQIENTAVKNFVNFEKGVLTGYIPINQTHKITKENGKWKASPIMEYSYMVAKQQVPQSERDKGVSLDFKPISTAIDVTLRGTDNTIKLSSFNIISESKQLSGQFTCDLNNWEDWTNTYPECTIFKDDMSRNIVTVDTRYGENNYIEIAPGDEITFTVFLMPQEDINDLVIRLSVFNMSAKELELSKKNVVVKPHKKSIVRATLPKWGADEANTWMDGIPNKVYISQLSIPGTANSASNMYSGDDNQYYKTQVVDLETQLKAGVRCFELRCTEGSGDDLSDAPLQCNRNNIGMTFGTAMEFFNDFLRKNPSEFIMVMPAYESNSGTGGAAGFTDRLNKYINNNNTPLVPNQTERFSVYGKDITIGEVRGTIMIIARIISEEYSETDAANIKDKGIAKGVVIEQWGSLKDMWGRRGYTLDGINRIDNWAKGFNNNTMEYYMLNGNNSADFVPSSMPTHLLENDFMHTTYRSNGTDGTAYVQDWARVSNGNHNYEINDWREGWSRVQQYVYWPSSVKEKEKDIWDTFLAAVTDNQGKQGSTFYINCIDGYFVNDYEYIYDYNWIGQALKKKLSAIPYIENYTAHSLSYTNGGIAGDIQSFAEHFNKFFYDKLVEYGSYNIAGSMNIVMLDRVLDGSVGGDNIVQMIVDNNYKFPLVTSDKKEPADASYVSGGNVIK